MEAMLTLPWVERPCSALLGGEVVQDGLRGHRRRKVSNLHQLKQIERKVIKEEATITRPIMLPVI